jgi:hypothetical protein
VDTEASTLATKEDFENTRAVLKSFTSSLIKWMFFFWLLNLITTFGFLWLFLKK